MGISLLLPAANQRPEPIPLPLSAQPLPVRRPGEPAEGPPRLRCFGDYELLEEIARGGMGVVFRARQISLNRTVALKLLQWGQFASDEFVRRFHVEAEAVASLQHPNIVAIHGVGVHEGQHFFSMDFVAGQNLADRARDHPLPFELAADYVKTIAEAIHHAHQRGVLHRDLKPSNVLIDALNQPRITDFGLAKRFNAQGFPPTDSGSTPAERWEAGTECSQAGSPPQLDLTVTGQMLGTPNYMPPEQVTTARGAVGTYSDIYSLGAVLYHLLTGRPPFHAPSIEQTLLQLLNDEPVQPRLLNSSVPHDLETICLKCLQKDPRHRYPSAQMLAEDLDCWRTGRPILARPTGAVERLRRWCRRKPAIAVALGSCLLLLLTLAVGSSIAAARIERARREAEANAVEERRQRSIAQNQQRLAERETRKSGEVARFLKDTIASLGPNRGKGRDGPELLLETLQQAEVRLNGELKNHPDVQAELFETLGIIYCELGEWSKSEALLRRALRFRQNGQGEEHPDTIHTMLQVLHALWPQRKGPEFQGLLQKSLALHLKVNGSNNVQTAKFLNFLSFESTNHAEAEIFNRRALEILSAADAANDPQYGITLQNLAHHLNYQQRVEEAVGYAEQAVALLRRVSGDQDLHTIDAVYELALTLRGANQLATAEAAARESWQASRKLLGATNEPTLKALWLLVNTTFERGDLAGTEAILADAPLDAIPPDWAGRNVAGEDERFWLGRTLAGVAEHHRAASSASSARRYARHAEELARPLLLMRQSSPATSAWRIANSQSLLGGALVVQAATDVEPGSDSRVAKLAKAERLLSEGYDVLRHSAVIPPDRRSTFLREALERLVRLHELWDTIAPGSDTAAEAAQWRGRLKAFDPAAPE